MQQTWSLSVSRTVPRGAYPERDTAHPGRFEALWQRASDLLSYQGQMRRLRLQRFVREVQAQSQRDNALGAQAIRVMADELRYRLRGDGWHRDLLARTFALVRAVATQTLGLTPFDVQVMGGWVLLHGMVAEMHTGEGKTLAATLPACTMALAGVPVHIVTVNDYLAQRDAASMGPLYRALGLTVGIVVQGMPLEARQAAYACDVTYCTNKELAFDYLKDRLALGRQQSWLQLQVERVAGTAARRRRLMLRGLHYAIVDEADSILIDAARTPLIIASGAGNAPEQRAYQRACQVAAQLTARRDFVCVERELRVHLTEDGRERLAGLTREDGGLWAGRQRREALMSQALTALHLLQRDTHYLVKDGKVQIIDEFTGRIMQERAWEHGLHQLVETKEGCALTGVREPLARLSYQRFFRRYLRLAGMTGTAHEVRAELWAVYRLAVVTIPTNRPPQRRYVGTRVYATTAAKWAAVLERLKKIHGRGQPLLVGTRSVAASEQLSHLLTIAGLPHQVLNARQDSAEADVIAHAGAPGRIVVATNMAGRGTDIRLAAGVAELGGLHVIATAAHEARRIDRQLFGRCGRQGDPGSYEMLVSLDDEIITVYAGHLWRWLGSVAVHLVPYGPRLGALIARRAQRRAERLHARMRRDLLTMDEHLESALAFSGRLE
jgi:preprotein translocase subunit SecA